MASGGQVAWLGERQTVAFHFNGRSQRCTCAMDVTKAGVAAVCERVLAGHCGLQRLSGLEPLLISSRVIAWMALCYCAWCHCLLVSRFNCVMFEDVGALIV